MWFNGDRLNRSATPMASVRPSESAFGKRANMLNFRRHDYLWMWLVKNNSKREKCPPAHFQKFNLIYPE